MEDETSATHQPDPATSRRQGVRAVVGAALLLALVSLASNWTFPAELSGDLPVYSFVRKTISKLANAGTVWAGIAVFAAWRMRRAGFGLLAAVAAAVGAAEAALVVHYALGFALRLYEWSIWSSNWHWFAAGVLLCAPLALVGWVAAGRGVLALPALLVVPVGAVAEPFVLGMFSPWPQLPWPQRWSTQACGAVLLALGLAGIVGAIVVARRRPGT